MVYQEKNNFKNIYLILLFPNYIFKTVNTYNSFIEIYNKRIIHLFYLINKHYNTQLKIFVDLVSSDYPSNELRFQNSYNLLSVEYNRRIIFKTFISKYNAIESIINIYNNANWYERESWDLYGILYYNHFDLRRILNDYNYKGYPLRKDFPLLGFVEFKYNYIKKNISCSEVNVLYRFRMFNNQYNWKYI